MGISESKALHVTSPDDSGGARAEKTLSLIRTLGIIVIVLGALPTCDYLLRLVLLFRALRAGMKPPPNMPFILIFFVFSMALPVVKTIAGCGLLKLRSWARKITIAVFGIDYSIGLIAAFYFCADCYHYRHMPAALYDMELTIGALRMLPTYIFSLISLLFIALLTRGAVSNAFSKEGALSP